MAGGFAALEQRTNRAVMARLSNAFATFVPIGAEAATEPRAVIFDSAYVRADVGGLGMASAELAVTIATSDLPASVVGRTLTIGASTFKVAESQPDGTGLSVLILERVL